MVSATDVYHVYILGLVTPMENQGRFLWKGIILFVYLKNLQYYGNVVAARFKACSDESFITVLRIKSNSFESISIQF